MTFPLKYTDDRANDVAEFNIQFYVIDGDPLFPIGLPCNMAMKACINFKLKNLDLLMGSSYIRIPLIETDSHVLLPFKLAINRSECDNISNRNSSSNQYTSLHNQQLPSSHYEPTSAVTKNRIMHLRQLGHTA